MTSDGARADPPTSLLFDIFALNQALGRMLDAYMSDSPLTPSEYAFYSAIFETESVTPSALAHRLGMPLTTVMDHIARLARRGHLARWQDPADRRATRVVLTAHGQDAHRAANLSFYGAYQAFERAMPLDESGVQETLALVRRAIDDAAREAPRAQTPSERLPAVEAPRQVRSRSRSR